MKHPFVLLLFVTIFELVFCKSSSNSKEDNGQSGNSLNTSSNSTNGEKLNQIAKNHDSYIYYFDPDISIITGKLVIRKFLGPPGFGETPKIDAHYSFYFLKLPHLIKILPADTTETEIDSVSQIQFLYLEKGTKDDTLKKYLDHTIQIKGRLLGRDGSPAEITRVLMEIGSATKR